MTEDAYIVRGGAVVAPDRTILSELSFTIPRQGVTVVLGPAACGKSKLLQALRGSLPTGWRRTGEWRQCAGSVAHVQQGIREEPWLSWFDGEAGLLLLDEPDRAVSEDALERLVRCIRAYGTARAVVVVTHNITFAQSVATTVILLCNGEILEMGEAAPFFASPRHPLGRRFVAEGNCWPPPARPDLPTHFHWLIQEKLAGMGRPGLLRDEEDDLSAIAEHGISLLVSLTERPFSPERLRAFGVAGRHFPIPDMGVPSCGATARLCRSIEKTIEQGGAVAVHCLAGRGRTGTILAAYLVWTGVPAAEAVSRVRATIDGAIQTAGQLAFVREFEEVA